MWRAADTKAAKVLGSGRRLGIGARLEISLLWNQDSVARNEVTNRIFCRQPFATCGCSTLAESEEGTRHQCDVRQASMVTVGWVGWLGRRGED